jgi:eukaryotic-like serine/threonine-protein kinase
VTVIPDRWQQIARIYETVVEHDPAERAALLNELCAGDESIRREVHSLLRQDDVSLVLDRPVWVTAAPLFRGEADFGPGAALGPYRLDDLLGAGGMGEVFSATDTRLNRRVAIKVLPRGIPVDQQVRTRFAREAEAIAALTHPHIGTLYDIGRHGDVDFLVMERLEGDTLAARLLEGALPADLALTYARQIASALDHAHRHGVVHRDLKPANIMLTVGGAKLLDFGLAKFRAAADAAAVDAAVSGDGTPAMATPAADDSNATGDPHLTRGGAILGTVRYMAPEQITGQEVDARSDLFSFGAVLHEMFTGRRAFDGTSAASIRVAILTQDPPAVSAVQPQVPRAVDDIVHRCLAKEPARRWQTAAEILRQLDDVAAADGSARTTPRSGAKWATAVGAAALTAWAGWMLAGRPELQRPAAPIAAIRSLAVLPLDGPSNDPEGRYLADGMTEQLITDLASSGGLRVISPTAVTRYTQPRKALPAIAKELGVDGIVDGTVARVAGNVRITARLVRGASGEVLSTHSFERPLRDGPSLPRDVARTITNQLAVPLTPQMQARLGTAGTVDPEVHRYVLLGRHHAAKGTEDALRKGMQYYTLALARAPDSAMAHAGLAEAYMSMSGYYLPPREAMPRAKRAAEAAIRADDGLADAHAVLGFIHLVYDWDGPAAERELRRALALNPSLATARLHYAAYLTTQIRHDEAVAEIRRAVESDPVSIRTNALATSLLLFARRYDDAIELARRGFEFEPNGFALAFQGVAFAEQHRFAEAVDNMERAARLDGSATIRSLHAHVLALAGRKTEARQVIRQVEESARQRYFCPYEIATAHMSLGDHDTAYRWLRKGIEQRADCMAWLGVEPWIEGFRADPRYPTLLREIGLDPAAR